MSVAVIGLGYVGLPLALRAVAKGYTVIGVDTDKEKLARLNDRNDFLLKDITREAHLNDDDLKRFNVTNDFASIKSARIVIVCVPTPVHHDHMPDLRPLKGAVGSIAPHLFEGTLVVIESTVNPGVCESVVLPLLEKGSGRKVGSTLFLAHCPERINPGDENWNVSNIPRVAGGFDKESLDRCVAFYSSIIDAPIHPLASIAEAEAVKVVENSFRDVNIAFVNELAMSFDKLGIDVVNVIKAAATKPFSFMAHFPGCGVGGHCIPVDPYYLIECGRQNGFSHKFLSLARTINNDMPRYTVSLLSKALNKRGQSLAGTTVGVLGLSYKPDIDDCRESPSFAIIDEIRRSGGVPIAFDPHVLGRSDVASMGEVLSQAKAVVVATAHKAFRAITPRDLSKHQIEIVIDGRNCLSEAAFADSGILYKGVGR